MKELAISNIIKDDIVSSGLRLGQLETERLRSQAQHKEMKCVSEDSDSHVLRFSEGHRGRVGDNEVG